MIPWLGVKWIALLPAVLLAAPDTFETAVAPVTTRYCGACHNAKARAGNLNLAFSSAREAFVDPEIWEEVVAKLANGQMPPKGLPRPTGAELRAATSYLTAELTRLARSRKPDPGRVTARRLNRAEYDATIRDVLGLEADAASGFPADDAGYGFDNIGDVLSLSPLLMEKYLAAADRISRQLIWTGPALRPTLHRILSNREEQARRVQPDDPDGYPYPPGAFEARHRFPVDAEYSLIIKVTDRRADKTPIVPVSFFLDGEKLGTFNVQDGEYQQGEWEVRRFVAAGEHTLYGAFPDDYIQSGPRDPQIPGSPIERRIFVDLFEVRGPNNHDPSRSSAYQRLMRCDSDPATEDCARKIAARTGRALYRRPLEAAETDRLLNLYRLARTQGDSFDHGVQLMVKAMLVSPQFLFRVEPASRDNRSLTPVELASRLAYFLWGSAPDEPLLSAAETGRLAETAVLDAEIKRLLADPRSGSLAGNFAGQWLQLRNLKTAQPDPARFPAFNEGLREAMMAETRLFFENVVREDRPVTDFLDANYTYLNARLARHYGVEGVSGRQMRRVELNRPERRGVLTHASILTISSYPTRTSPVLRGLWVLDNFLGAPPPPPPGDVPPLDEQKIGLDAPLRKQLEQHRANAACAVCHDRIDPIGFALENYDPIGRWRSQDGKFPIDAAGNLPDGRSFQDAAGFMKILAADRDAFTRALAGKLLTYALGRGLERYDREAVDSIAEATRRDGYRFGAMVRAIVQSMPFRMRRGEIIAKGQERQ